MPTGTRALGSATVHLHWELHPRVLRVWLWVHTWLCVSVSQTASWDPAQGSSPAPCQQEAKHQLQPPLSDVFKCESDTKPRPPTPPLLLGLQGPHVKFLQGLLKFFLLGWSCGGGTPALWWRGDSRLPENPSLFHLSKVLYSTRLP